MDDKDIDLQFYRLALNVITEQLDLLVGACTNSDGSPKAPDRADLMRAKGMLPVGCKNSFAPRKKG